MKPKTAITTRGRSGKGKIVKKELVTDDILSSGYGHPKPSVEITKCISFQKFRYRGENRPGKKYQDKEFMELKLSNLQDKVVRVVIICTDAENRELIHPNGLVGKDCHDGIYDKEYAITEQFRLITIPYLRTERVKTKKNQQENIRTVLTERASHLPSPYKERCLSQCSDKYTATRKFDTTKVCLGVIVTVQSHQGIYNGSLHAISHVVKTASEKTVLEIIKLSETEVSATRGALVDIFTTEGGPPIEPEKYCVYVTCNYKAEGLYWQSEKFIPSKEDILYKKIITYIIPPFQPNMEVNTDVEAKIHLECSQSNQFTEFAFTYVPPGEIVVVDEESFNGHKRALIEQDIKPSAKRMRMDVSENDGSTEAIKANLKTKLKARQEPPIGVETVYFDSQGDSQGEISRHYIIRGHQQHQPAHVETYSRSQPVLIRHQDPHTGESSFLLDMDSNKGSSNSGSAYIGGENQSYAIQLRDRNAGNQFVQEIKAIGGKGSPFSSHSLDGEVVATAYSDDVPPNTTVLIYTTNGSGDRVAINTSPGEVIQEISDDDSRPSSHAVSIQNSSGEQIIHRETAAERKILISKASPHHRNVTATPDNSRMLHSLIQDGAHKELNRLVPSAAVGTNDIHVSTSTPSTGSSVANQYNQDITSSPSSIPPIRRMLIPNKTMSSASPWEVGTSDETDNDYSMVMNSFTSYGKKPQYVAVKKEASDEESFTHRNNTAATVVSSSGAYTRQPYPIAEKQLQNLEASESVQTIAGDAEVSASGTQITSTSNQAGIPSSTDKIFNQLSNLPTDDIMRIAENFQDTLPSSTEEVRAEAGTEN